MRSIFQRMPFVRITSLFMAGILISRLQVLNLHLLALLIAVLVSVQLLLWFSGNYTKIQVQNFSLALLLLISGAFYPKANIARKLPDLSAKSYFLAEVCQKPTEKSKTFQTVLQIQNQQMSEPEKILAYFSKNSFDTGLTIGDQLVILTKPQLIKNRNNPFEFDYQSFIRKKGIWFSAYLAEGTWMKTGRHFDRLSDFSEKIRQKLLAILAEKVNDREERSVIEALTLGYREELDPETKNYFANTGAMHVLAVSGLHVGLIYFILSFVFAGLKRLKIGSFALPALLISLLWLYAFITGFSPSVQRATVMFTFVIIGDAIRRPVNIFNSLAASALVLMLINPDVIFDVGFQLSYLAVFGIVLIQPRLSALISPKNKLIKAAWELFTVSVAAQLATFPLGLFYFNQTSNLFWASNFIVIPAATLLMWVTFPFFVFSFLPLISDALAFILKWVTHLMILALKYLSELPFAVSDGIVIDTFQVWLIYGILAAALVFLFSKQKPWLFYTLIFATAFQLINLKTNLKLFNQQAVFVYNSPTRLIHFINGRKNYLVATRNDSLSAFESEMVKSVQDHLKLEKPILISGKIRGRFSTEDLCFDRTELCFLNCRITLPNRSKSENISVEIYRKGKSKMSPVNFRNETEKAILPRLDSAYYFSLKKE